MVRGVPGLSHGPGVAGAGQGSQSEALMHLLTCRGCGFVVQWQRRRQQRWTQAPLDCSGKHVVVFTDQISVLIKGGGGGRWEGEGGAGLSDNVINGVCLPGNGGGGGRRLTDVHAVICARGGSGGDIGREGWAVAHQAWGSGTAGYSEGTVGMLMD